MAVGAGGLAVVLAGLLVIVGLWLGTGGLDVPYQDAQQVQGVRLEADCQECLVLQVAAGPTSEVTIRLTATTRYDDRRPFPVGEPVTAWVRDTPNADGSWDALEVNPGTGTGRG